MDVTVKGFMDDDYFAYLNVFVFNPENYAVSEGVKAIIDTGAQDCLVKRSFAGKMGLKPVDKLRELNPLGGVMESDYYRLGLILDTANYTDATKYAILKMGAIEEEGYPAELILGGTFLRHCTFSYDGHNRTFELRAKL